jgi:hypothetical protein
MFVLSVPVPQIMAKSPTLVADKRLLKVFSAGNWNIKVATLVFTSES